MVNKLTDKQILQEVMDMMILYPIQGGRMIVRLIDSAKKGNKNAKRLVNVMGIKIYANNKTRKSS